MSQLKTNEDKLSSSLKNNLRNAGRPRDFGLSATAPATTGSNNSLAGIMLAKRRLNRWRLSRNGSMAGSGPRKPQLQNTYRMLPQEAEAFDEAVVKQEIEESLKLYLAKPSDYDAKKSAQVIKTFPENHFSHVNFSFFF